MIAIVSGNTENQLRKLSKVKEVKAVYHDIPAVKLTSLFNCPVYYEPNLCSAVIASDNIKQSLFIVSKANNIKSKSLGYLTTLGYGGV